MSSAVPDGHPGRIRGRVVVLMAAWVGERAGARRDTGQCGFDVGDTRKTRGHDEAPGPGGRPGKGSAHADKI